MRNFFSLSKDSTRPILHAEGLCLLLLSAITIVFCEALFFGFSSQRIFLYNFNGGDAIHWYSAIKVILEEGWIFSSTRLAWPWGMDFLEFPFGGMLDFFILRVVAFFTNNIFKVAAYALVAYTVIGALTAYFMMRVLGVNRFFAFIFALIFAFSPNLYYRNVAHIHSLGYMAPIGAGLAILIFSGKRSHWKNIKKDIFSDKIYLASLICLAFLLGFTYAYVVAFSLFFLVLGIVRQIFVPTDNNASRNLGCKFLIALLVGFFLSSLPAFYSYQKEPLLKEKLMSFKIPTEADLYGLYIRSLLRPVPTSLFPYKQIEKKYISANFAADNNEQTAARLGTTGSLGFLLLLVCGLRLINISVIQDNSERRLVFYALASLTLAAILLGVPGGFGSMINMISPQIRAYNRLSPFFAFLSLSALGVWLTAIYCSKTQWQTIPIKKLIGIVGIIWACYAIIVDQRPIHGCLFKRHNSDTFSAQAMLKEFSCALPSQARILFLPVLPYPLTPNMGEMPAGADAIPYLMDNGNYYWSVLPLSPTAEQQLLALVRLRGDDFLRAVRAIGYDSILYDVRANTPEYLELVRSIEGKGLIESKSQDGRYILFTNPLSQVKETDMDSEVTFYHDGPKLYAYKSQLEFASDSVGILNLGVGWYPPENWGVWAGKHAELLVPVPIGVKGISLYGHFYGGENYSHLITIRWKQEELVHGQYQGECFIFIPLPPDLNYNENGIAFLNLEMDMPNAVSPMSLNNGNDGRRISFGLKRIEYVD